MSESTFKTYEDLPLNLSIYQAAEVLGISKSKGYELLKEGMPSFRIGSRVIVPRDEFLKWIDERKKLSEIGY